MAKILQPITIGRLHLPNRLVMPPMGLGRATNTGHVTAGILEHYDERSQGGFIGLIIVEYSYVSQAGRSDPRQLSVADDAVIPGLTELARIIHQNGSRCVVQINYDGAAAPADLTRDEIRGIVADFARAAGRVKAAGFDGVEIHAAHGFLLSRFFSPLTNKRDDDYNGDVHQRIKLHLDVIAAIRETVGEDFPVLIRFGASDLVEGGATSEDGVIAARSFEAAGVDALDISRGLLISDKANPFHDGLTEELARSVKSQVRIPVLATGGVRDAQAAQTKLTRSSADLVGVGSAILKNKAWARETIQYWQDQEAALWREYVSNVLAGTGNNLIRRWTGPEVLTFRSYYRVRAAGDYRWRFWFANTVDSKYDQGEQAWPNRSGGRWQIRSAAVGVSGRADGSLRPATLKQVTYDSRCSKWVDPDERFWSDEVSLNVQKDDYLVFTWCIAVDQAGDMLPFTPDSQIPAYVAPGEQTLAATGEPFVSDVNCAKPNLLAIARPVRKRVTFIGDSITQGVGTRVDFYEQWAARIGQGLPADVAVWNIGLGYARAADAATDGAWLAKARQSDEINICLGVNDLLHENRSAETILDDLAEIVRILKESGVASLILFTVPPFNFTEEREKNWRRLNQIIRTKPPAGVDRVFDIAAVLSRPAPEENISRYDPHPGGDGCAAVADAYLVLNQHI